MGKSEDSCKFAFTQATTKNKNKPVRDAETMFVCLEYLETKLKLDQFQQKYKEVVGNGILSTNKSNPKLHLL